MRRTKTTGVTVSEFVEDTLFTAYFVKPDFLTTEDMPTLQRIICQLGGMRELMVIVPEDFNEAQINQRISDLLAKWSTERKPLFEKVYSLLSIEYNPLDNYDRKEESTVTSTGTNTSTSTSTSTGTSASSSSSDAKNNVMPIDGTDDSDLVTSGGGTSEAQTINSNRDNATASNSGSTNGQTISNSRVHGNIGIVDNVTLLTKELGFRGGAGSAMRYIAETFLADFASDYWEI